MLKDYLLAHQQGVGCQLPTSPITINDFKQAYQVQTKTKFKILLIFVKPYISLKPRIDRRIL